MEIDMSFDTSKLGEHWSGRYEIKKYIWGTDASGIARHALEIFKKHDLKTLLLAACGYGRNSKLFADSGMDVTGVDSSTVGIVMAREFDPKSNYVCASVMDMPFDGPFDAVFSLNALHLFPPPESGWSPETLLCSALKNSGIIEIWEKMRDYQDLTSNNGFFDARRKEQSIFWMHESIRDNLNNHFYTNKDTSLLVKKLEKKVKAYEISSFDAANILLKEYFDRFQQD